VFSGSGENTPFFDRARDSQSVVRHGKHPISPRTFPGHKFTMRHKTGNGHNVDLETFLEDIKTVVRDGQELLKAGAGEVKQKAVYGAQTTDRAIRNSPYQTIGIVFGVGLIVGLLASSMFSGGSEEQESD
jgi:ElaB/YqjD/DUF883 family membrane-anchored ribosome-binding protein